MARAVDVVAARLQLASHAALVRPIQLAARVGVEARHLLFSGIVDDCPAAFALAGPVHAALTLFGIIEVPQAFLQAVDEMSLFASFVHAFAYPQALALAFHVLTPFDHRAIVPGQAVNDGGAVCAASELLWHRLPRHLPQAVVGQDARARVAVQGVAGGEIAVAFFLEGFLVGDGVLATASHGLAVIAVVADDGALRMVDGVEVRIAALAARDAVVHRRQFRQCGLDLSRVGSAALRHDTVQCRLQAVQAPVFAGAAMVAVGA